MWRARSCALRYITHLCVWHDSFEWDMLQTWMMHGTQRVWHIKSQSHSCKVTHTLWEGELDFCCDMLVDCNESFVCVTWLIHESDVTKRGCMPLEERLGRVISRNPCVLRIISVCDMTHSWVWRDSERLCDCESVTLTLDVTYSFMCAARIFWDCDCDVIYSQSRIICVCDVIHSVWRHLCVLHDSSMCVTAHTATHCNTLQHTATQWKHNSGTTRQAASMYDTSLYYIYETTHLSV